MRTDKHLVKTIKALQAELRSSKERERRLRDAVQSIIKSARVSPMLDEIVKSARVSPDAKLSSTNRTSTKAQAAKASKPRSRSK